MSKNILVIDRDKSFVKSLAYNLKDDGFKISALYEGRGAVNEVGKKDYDLILLDIDLPDVNGCELCYKIREQSLVPIIILSEREDIMDKIISLESGADDYLVKPFNIQELKTRIKVIFRRISYEDTDKIEKNLEIGEFIINRIGRTIEIDGHEINLTGKEFDLFYILITNAGKIFSREELLDLVWGEDYFGDGRTIDVHIRRIRKKLETVTKEDIYILTKWGVGYYFESSIL